MQTLTLPLVINGVWPTYSGVNTNGWTFQVYSFPNGYGIEVIRSKVSDRPNRTSNHYADYSRFPKEGTWEAAIVKFNSTSIHDYSIHDLFHNPDRGVYGWQDENDLSELFAKVMAFREVPRYIILDVEYLRNATYGFSLAWICPALKDAKGLEMTEDNTFDVGTCEFCEEYDQVLIGQLISDPDQKVCRKCHNDPRIPTEENDNNPVVSEDEYPNRKWSGIITHEEWGKLRREWDIDLSESEPNLGMTTEYGYLAGYRFGWDGMDWNVGGETPIAYVSLSASIPAGEEDA